LVTDLAKEIEAITRSQLPGLGVRDQRVAADVLQGEVGLCPFAFVERAGVVDLGDVGVLEASEDLRLVLEAFHGGTGGHAPPHHLQGHDAMGVVLHRLVDGAHTAGAENAADLVAPDAVGGGRPIDGLLLDRRDGLGVAGDGRLLDEALRGGVVGEQGLDLFP
jgi:hypothetical protein